MPNVNLQGLIGSRAVHVVWEYISRAESSSTYVDYQTVVVPFVMGQEQDSDDSLAPLQEAVIDFATGYGYKWSYAAANRSCIEVTVERRRR